MKAFGQERHSNYYALVEMRLLAVVGVGRVKDDDLISGVDEGSHTDIHSHVRSIDYLDARGVELRIGLLMELGDSPNQAEGTAFASLLLDWLLLLACLLEVRAVYRLLR